MAYVHKPGTFSLFKNDKEGVDGRPDYKGYGKSTDGKDIEVAAWIKEGGKGKFMSCTFKSKEAQQPQPQTRRQPAKVTGNTFDDMDDDIPL